MRPSALCSLVVAAVLGPGLAAQAQSTPPTPAQARAFKSPKISAAYAGRLQRLPDWNGRWRPTSGRKPRPAEILFDPFAFYNPPDPAPAEDEGAGLVGPMPGAYLTDIPYNDEWRARYRKIVQDTAEGRSIDGAQH